MLVEDDAILQAEEESTEASLDVFPKKNYTRIYRKSSPDGNVILFLPQRYLSVSEKAVDPLVGVTFIHRSILLQDIKVFVQILLLFRYGREDEEMMGIKFCNEIVMASEQIYHVKDCEKLIFNKAGFMALPIMIQIKTSAPPTIRLLPCRPYAGVPIGTSYEIQVFASSSPDVIPKPRKLAQMALYLYEQLPKSLPPKSLVTIRKHLFLSEESVWLNISLDKAVYTQTDTIYGHISIYRKNGPHGAKKLKIAAVQQVNIAMFSNGSFKNYLGHIQEELEPTQYHFTKQFKLNLALQKEFAWVALQPTNGKKEENSHFSPSVILANGSIFIIKVHYYIQVSIAFGLLKRDLNIKLPFILKSQKNILND